MKGLEGLGTHDFYPESPSVELEHVLDAIDFDKMHELYKEKIMRCGVDPEVMGFAARKDIKGAQASLFKRGVIAVSSNEWGIILVPNSKEEIANYEATVLGAIFHEETHRASHTTHGNIVFDEQSSGYERARIDVLTLRRTFGMFNEGVTDMIAEEMFDEYTRRYGVDLDNLPSKLKYKQRYTVGRRIVSFVCERVAKGCGLSRDVVWRGIQRGYFEGLDLSHGEGRTLLEETFSPHLASLLESSNEPNDMDTRALDLRATVDDFSDNLKERWTRFLGKGMSA